MTNETEDGSLADGGGSIWISATIFAACAALYIAEQNGFRIFEANVIASEAGDAAVPSPLEVLTVLGTTSVGVCAGLVACISTVGWLVRRVRQLIAHAHSDSHSATPAGAAMQAR